MHNGEKALKKELSLFAGHVIAHKNPNSIGVRWQVSIF